MPNSPRVGRKSTRFADEIKPRCADHVEEPWRSCGDHDAGVNGIISLASAAGHVVLSSNLTAWDIRGTQPDARPVPATCPGGSPTAIHDHSPSNRHCP